jgi:NAD(P)-dependent dehydrogenase (short-subunit alcohol dehydrogenase family)
MSALTSRTALVTGGGRGIGRAIAVELARAGATVAIAARTAAELAATIAEIDTLGVKGAAFTVDLADRASAARLVADVAVQLGTVDILVNNAGVFHRESLLETTVEQWEETQAVNLRAPFLLAQVVVPGMIKQQSGKVINISSLAAQVGCEGHAAYSSSKGGLNMLTRVMAAEWGPSNIQTNSVAPRVRRPRGGTPSPAGGVWDGGRGRGPRVRSRRASAAPWGTAPGVRAPARRRHARGTASRRAVGTRAPAGWGLRAGVTTPQPGPCVVSSRERHAPHGPASETQTRGGALAGRGRPRGARSPGRAPMGPRERTAASGSWAPSATVRASVWTARPRECV